MTKKKIVLLAFASSGLVLSLFFAIAQEKKGTIAGQRQNEVVTDTTNEEGTLTNDDPWNETEKLVNAYYYKEGSYYSGIMKLTDENSDKEKVIEEKTFECTLLDNNYHYRIGGIEVISQNDLILFADNDNKTIALAGKAATGKNKATFFNIAEFKKLMQERKASARVSQSGEVKMLSVDNIEDPTIQGYRIYYDPVTYKIKKILIGMVRLSALDGEEDTNANVQETGMNAKNDKTAMNEDNDEAGIDVYTYFLEITYSEIKGLHLKEEGFHPENKFIRITDKKIELQPAYSSYQLMNNLEQ